MVSPNKKQERESREQKQKKLKKQLDTALDKTTEKLNKSKDQNWLHLKLFQLKLN